MILGISGWFWGVIQGGFDVSVWFCDVQDQSLFIFLSHSRLFWLILIGLNSWLDSKSRRFWLVLGGFSVNLSGSLYFWLVLASHLRWF